jgi:hypothetical protein
LEKLRAYDLSEGRYWRTEEPIWFPSAGSGLRIWQGQFEDCDEAWLRWYDAKGIPIPTGQERAEAALELVGVQAQRAEAERQRAESERQRAEAERQRADRLAEQLRQLGIEPDKQ